MKIYDVENAVFEFVSKESASLGVKASSVYWTQLGKPIPPKPYVAMDWTTGPVAIGFDDVRQVSNGKYEVVGQRRASLQLTACGDAAFEIANQLVTAMNRPTALERLRARGVGIMRRGSVADASILTDTEYQNRARIEFEISFVHSVSDDLNWIEDAEVNGQPVNP